MIFPRDKLPDTWAVTRISDIAQIIMGQAPPGKSYNEEERGLPLIAGASDLGQEYPIPSRWTTAPTSICQAQDIIFCIRATIGDMNWADREYCLGRGVAAIRADENLIDRFFLFYWLLTNKEYFIRKGTGTTFLQIRRQDLATALIFLPALPEQREIVKILRLTDRLRQLRAEVDRRSEELALATFNNLFGFIDKNAPYPQVRLEKISDIVSGVMKGRNLPTHETVNVPYLRVANVQAGYLDLSEIKTIDVLPSDVEKYAIQQGDILLTEGGDFDKLGRGGMWEHDIPNCIHQNHVFRVRVNKEVVLPLFLNYYLQTAYARHYFLRAAKRTTNLASINLSQLSALPVFLPSLEMQQKFINAVNQIRALLVTQEQTVTEIDRLSRSAMINAFTGQLTENYRQQSLAELTRLAGERDFALSHPTLTEQLEETKPVQKRSSLEFSLSPSQRNLLIFIEGQNSYVTDDNLDIGSELSPNELRRNLDLLARLGLVKVAQIAVTPGELGRVFFTKVYRALRPEDDLRETDLAILSEAQQQ